MHMNGEQMAYEKWKMRFYKTICRDWKGTTTDRLAVRIIE